MNESNEWEYELDESGWIVGGTNTLCISDDEEEQSSGGQSSSAEIDLEQAPGPSMPSLTEEQSGPSSTSTSDDETMSNVTVTDLLAPDDF